MSLRAYIQGVLVFWEGSHLETIVHNVDISRTDKSFKAQQDKLYNGYWEIKVL